MPDDADPLDREVRTLGELLQQVKDEQEYIKVRERVHRNSIHPKTLSIWLRRLISCSRGEYEFKSQMVGYIPNGCVGWSLCLSSCISQTVLWLAFTWLMLGSSRLRELCERFTRHDKACGIDGIVLCIDRINKSSCEL